MAPQLHVACRVILDITFSLPGFPYLQEELDAILEENRRKVAAAQAAAADASRAKERERLEELEALAQQRISRVVELDY